LSRGAIQNIALTGFMAVGKSAVGRALARKLRRRFVDLDRLIEKAEGMRVRDIFSQKGESYFRQLEKKALAAVLQQEGQVIATGGGVVMDEQNLKMLREKSLLVCLTASPDVLVLLKGLDRKGRVEELLKQREKNYAQAHAIIDTSQLTVEQIVEKIIHLLNVEK